MGQKGKAEKRKVKICNIVIVSQLCTPTKLQFSSLFTPSDVSKCKIRCQLVQEDYISRRQTSSA